MDKNMINIDDLVRDRLSGGEEDERTGAWLQMRDLLDKNMPVNTAPVAFGWKRITGYIAGLVLVTALSVGGYKAITHGTADKHTADNPNTGNTGATGANNTTGTAATATTGKPAADAAVAANPNRTSLNNYGQDNAPAQKGNAANGRNNGNTNHNGHAAASNGNQDAAQALAGNTGNTLHRTGNRILKSENVHGPRNAGTASPGNGAADNGTALLAADNMRNTGTNIGSSVNSIGDNSNHSTAAHSVQPVHPESVQRRRHTLTGGNNDMHTMAAAGNSAADNITPGATAAIPSNTGNNNRPAGTGSAHSLPTDGAATTAPALKKDTIEKIHLVQHFSRRQHAGARAYETDTIGVEKMVVTSPLERTLAVVNNTPAYKNTNAARIAGPATNKSATANTAIVPAAGLHTKSAEANAADAGSQLVPLSNYRVASRKLAWDPQRFEEMVDRFKFKLAQLKFYPGMIAGINASMFGPNTLGGFQLGLSSSMTFNEHLSLSAELKYISRFNSGVAVRDDFSGKPSDSTAVYNAQGTSLEYMIYTRDSVRHYFNFSMLHSVELPISVRYSIGRFFMMGGVNLAYHFKIAAEEVERHTAIKTVVPYNHPAITWPEGKGQISSKDLNSRFEIGGLLGVGYEMTPAVQLDLRVTKSFLDNARTNGAKAVSDQLYKSPSIQLSIGYKFHQQQRH